MRTSTGGKAAIAAGFLVAVVLMAANLRAALTGVGSLLPTIERDTGLSETWGGPGHDHPVSATDSGVIAPGARWHDAGPGRTPQAGPESHADEEGQA